MKSKKGVNFIVSSNSTNEQVLMLELRTIKKQIREINNTEKLRTKHLESRIQKLEESLGHLKVSVSKLQQNLNEEQFQYCDQYYYLRPRRPIH
jgi:hypothetical protein